MPRIAPARRLLTVVTLAALVATTAVTAESLAATPAHATTATTAGTTGTWLSGASGSGVNDGTLAAWRGRDIDIEGTWSDNNANSVQFWALRPGFPMANWTKPIDMAVGAIDSGETWAAAATGAYDARWTTSLKKLASLRVGDGTTYIRFAHEMNGNWYPWSVTKSNAAAFETSWKRYRALQKQYFPDAKLVFSVNRETTYGTADWRTYFPGSEYVDVLSVDYYNQWPYVGTDAEWKASLDDVDSFGAPKGLDKYVAYAKSQGLPLAISEWSGKAGNGDSAPWITNFMNYVSAHAGTGPGDILYEILFNVGGYSGNYQLHGSDARMPLSAAAYQQFFAGQTAAAASAAAAAAAAASESAAQAAADEAAPDQAAAQAAAEKAAADKAAADKAAAQLAAAKKTLADATTKASSVHAVSNAAAKKVATTKTAFVSARTASTKATATYKKLFARYLSIQHNSHYSTRTRLALRDQTRHARAVASSASAKMKSTEKAYIAATKSATTANAAWIKASKARADASAAVKALS